MQESADLVDGLHAAAGKDDDGEGNVSPRRGRSLSPASGRRQSPRSRSPAARGRSLSPTFADATYAAVQAAMHRRQLQVGELRVKLSSSQDQQASLRRQLDEVDSERRRLDLQLIAIKEERDFL
jgi:septal ring factor EnvC (AmiA/AmiB activator)